MGIESAIALIFTPLGEFSEFGMIYPHTDWIDFFRSIQSVLLFGNFG
jgi:hypothetical protein